MPAACRSTHLVADRQRDLVGGVGQRLVVADERPRQDRHRAGQHALDRLVGQRLRVGGPVDRHRRGPGDVTVEDRRAHAAAAVGLHPAVLGGGEAVQLLGEVLHHVVALRLAVHQHVQAESSCSSMTSAISGSHPARRTRPRRSRRRRSAARACAELARSAGTSRSWWSAAAAGRSRCALRVAALRRTGRARGRRCATSRIRARTWSCAARVARAPATGGAGRAISSARRRAVAQCPGQSDDLVRPSRRRTPASCAVRRRGRSRAPACRARAAASTSRHRDGVARAEQAGQPVAARRRRSVRQMLRPSTMPATSVLSASAGGCEPSRSLGAGDQVDADRLDRRARQRRQRGAEVTEVGRRRRSRAASAAEPSAV